MWSSARTGYPSIQATVVRQSRPEGSRMMMRKTSLLLLGAFIEALHGRSHRGAPQHLRADAGSESPRKKPLIARLALHGVDPRISAGPRLTDCDRADEDRSHRSGGERSGANGSNSAKTRNGPAGVKRGRSYEHSKRSTTNGSRSSRARRGRDLKSLAHARPRPKDRSPYLAKKAPGR
jgi:hypothetical protein